MNVFTNFSLFVVILILALAITPVIFVFFSSVFSLSVFVNAYSFPFPESLIFTDTLHKTYFRFPSGLPAHLLHGRLQ